MSEARRVNFLWHSPRGDRFSPFRVLLLPLIGVLITDALFKFIAHQLFPTDGVVLFPGVMLRVFENTRGPFGVFPLWLAVGMSVLTLCGLGSQWLRVHEIKDTHTVSRLLGLLVGGGISNLSERLLFGHTTDILWIGQRTALNVADVAVLIGALGLLIVFWRTRHFLRSEPRARV